MMNLRRLRDDVDTFVSSFACLVTTVIATQGVAAAARS